MATFERNVFINCPFDPDYHVLFRPLIFTIYYLGLEPRIAFESADSGELRLNKIHKLITASQFSIHDLSRCRATRREEFFRLNMPFELGIDVGCRKHRKGKWSRKCFLLLEATKYDYQKALSDLSGVDLKAHKNDPLELIHVVRDWLVHEGGGHPVSYSEIKNRYDDFVAAEYVSLKAQGWTREDIEMRPLAEVSIRMKRWVARLDHNR